MSWFSFITLTFSRWSSDGHWQLMGQSLARICSLQLPSELNSFYWDERGHFITVVEDRRKRSWWSVALTGDGWVKWWRPGHSQLKNAWKRQEFFWDGYCYICNTAGSHIFVSVIGRVSVESPYQLSTHIIAGQSIRKSKGSPLMCFESSYGIVTFLLCYKNRALL